MSELDELKKRVDSLEGVVDACVGVINTLMEAIYEPEFVKKIDRLAEYGKRD